MKGFSLMELLIGLAILSLLTLTSFATYETWYQKKRLTQTVTEFITAIDLAKMLSTIRAETLYVCASTDRHICNPDWRGEVLVFTSNDPEQIQTILHAFSAIPTDIHFSFESLKKPPLYIMGNGEVANNSTFSIDHGQQKKTYTISVTGVVTQQY